MGLDTLLTKLLHQHNFHAFGGDPPHDGSHNILRQSAQELEEITFEKWAEKLKKKLQKMVNRYNFHNFRRDLHQDASHEI